MNESDEQTKNIVKKLGNNFEHPDHWISNQDINIWKNVQRVLKPYDVIIPYARWLAENIPINKVRIRRDFERVLVAISACALLHQYQREIVHKHDHEYLQASVSDYLIVRELFEGSLIKSVDGTSPKTEWFVNVVKKIHAEKKDNICSEDTETDHMVSIADIINITGASRRSVYNWLEPAVNNGFVEKIKFGNRVFFQLTGVLEGKTSTRESFLPEPVKLLNAFPEISRGLQFVDPITGEEMMVEDDQNNELCNVKSCANKGFQNLSY
jgi:hypothetical protein